MEDVTDVKMERDKDDGQVNRHTFALEETPCSSDKMNAMQLVASHAGALAESGDWRVELQ